MQSYTGGRFRDLSMGGSLKQGFTTLTLLFSSQHTLAGNCEFMRLYALLRKRAGDLDFKDRSRMLDLDTSESLAKFARVKFPWPVFETGRGTGRQLLHRRSLRGGGHRLCDGVSVTPYVRSGLGQPSVHAAHPDLGQGGCGPASTSRWRWRAVTQFAHAKQMYGKIP